MYLGVLSEFVPNVCQLMLNTGTPCVDTGADLQYMSDEPKMSLPSTRTHTHPHTHPYTRTHEQTPEMEKRADTADISVLFFSGCANILAVYAN